MASAVDRAAHSVSDATQETGNYFELAGKYAAEIVKANVTDRANRIAFAIAVAVCIAAWNPAPLRSRRRAGGGNRSPIPRACSGCRKPDSPDVDRKRSGARGGERLARRLPQGSGGSGPGDGTGVRGEGSVRAGTARRLAPLNAVLPELSSTASRRNSAGLLIRTDREDPLEGRSRTARTRTEPAGPAMQELRRP